MTNRERLEELLGVLLMYIERAEDEIERDFYDDLAQKTEQKIKEIEQ